MRASTFTLLAFLVPLAAAADPVPQKPAGASGLTVIPEEFLRRWDPVTFFFTEGVGLADGGPEDHPEKLVKMSPAHPGAYVWVDAHTLIFKPAEPWPALARITFTARGKTFKRTTLMAAPVQLSPYDGETGLEPVESVSMTFPEPVPPEALAKMVRIELRPLPGAGEKEVRVLRREEFRIKTIDRPNRAAAASYVLALGNAIPLGTRATVRFQLSLEEDRSDSFFETSFSTAEPFRVVSVGCRGRRYPVTPQGTKYQEDQAIRCSSDARAIEVELSTEPGALGPIEARNLVRVSPHVDRLELNTSGRILVISGDFAFDRTYRVTLHPVPLTDAKGRPLDLQKVSEVHLYFPKRPSFLHVADGHGMLERFGPKFIPLSGRGFTRLDLRIYPIDPFDLNFWPFGASPITVDESIRPAGPGEEPERIAGFDHEISSEAIGEQIRALGAPPLSRIVELPLGKTAGAATFGLDLAPHLQQLSGKNSPGHYLVGMRRLDGSNERVWMRVQVTDLSLSTLEGPGEAQFAVTRLSDGSAVPNAKIIVEGVDGGSHSIFFEATTDKNGFAKWSPDGSGGQVIRISVEHERDRLVLDANDAPEVFADNMWSSSEGQNWLGWATSGGEIAARSPPQTLCHLYTERPVYRPEDLVHFGGWVRVREAGRIKNILAGEAGFRLTIVGPGNVQFNVPVELGELGGFHREFSEKELPTGEFTAHLSHPTYPGMSCDVRFRMEAYRIPTFEVRLNGPDQAPMDKDVSIKLTGSYYAGGPVSGQPVRWRVTQYPYTWSPPTPRPGFNYSTDARWSRRPRFESNAGQAKEDRLDNTGAATLTLSPSMEPTAQPRTYIVEATVVGADEQTVTATHRTHAVPAFVLGLKVPRFIEHAKLIEPEIIAVAPKGELFADAEVTVRLIQRAWHSHLLAGDFTEGNAKYITDVVEQKLREEKVRTKSDGSVKLSLPIPEAGVYIVELEARDKLGRAQVVAVDLYAGGERPLAWQKPSNGVFTVAADEGDYDPGQTATLVLESPFKNARALAVVETPDGNQYSWVDVKGGTATFKVPVKSNYVPRLPVHFVLMRGRVPSTAADEGQKLDLGKPATMAATTFLTVNPVEHRVNVELKYPKKAQPGQEITVEVELSKKERSAGKKPVSGELDLWLVDQAVLALGKEQALDPLDAFITNVESRLGIRDTRGGVFGWLPLNETPGGDGDGDDSKNLLDRTTIRRKFSSVPFFVHALKIGPNGKATVKIRLPDNLTNFMIRAKAVSGEDRFGFATGQIAVRLPLVVQPALPRFVRAEDRVEGSAIARIVEGSGGEAVAAVRVAGEGAALTRAPSSKLTMKVEAPSRIDFSLAIGNPKKPAPDRDPEVTITAGVERKSDGARDAVEVNLPIKPDLEPSKKREILTFDGKTPLKIAALAEEARPGTVKRTILISERDALIRMAAALDFMLDYPYGATEHRISRAHVFLAMEDFRKTLHMEDHKKFTERAIADALDWLPQVTDAQGFCAYWPGGQTYVSLTAWTVELMTAAKKAGHVIDEKLYNRMLGGLERALRSDYSRFVDGAAWYERVVALRALAGAGRYQAGQAAELARKVEYLDLESIAGVSRVLSQNGQGASETVAGLDRELWDGVIIRLHQGREIYGGVQARHGAAPGMILPSETRTLAEISRALTAAGDRSPKLELLYDALVTLGRGDGWGTTNANASALLALSARLKPNSAAVKSAKITVRAGGKTQVLEVGAGAPVAYFETDLSGELVLETSASASFTARVESEYVPVTGGKAARAEAHGFVVTRELLRIYSNGDAPEKLPLGEPGRSFNFGTGEVVEEHVEVINQVARNYVAVVVPLAAGFDPLNPNLQTSPPESHPKGAITLKPTYATYLDDKVAFYYDSLPKGTYHFYFRVRATSPGTYTQPPAFAEMMYDRATRGRSAGAQIEVVRK